MEVKAEPQTLRCQKRVEIEHFVITFYGTQTDRARIQYVINKVNRGLWHLLLDLLDRLKFYLTFR
jgi:hypothetical protein